MTKFLKNCFILLIPILIWNLLLTGYLPKSYSQEIFWNGIPRYIGIAENILRMVVMVMPAIMIFSLKTTRQKVGLGFYLGGTFFYFLSWLLLIIYPNSLWSNSALGFMAPAYTPVVWLTGIGLIGNNSFLNIKKLSPIYITIALLFVFFHTLHVYLVYQNI